MAKNIVIGIGGTGLSTLRELRRLMAERYEQGLGDPAVASTRFLYIDTDSNDADRRGNWKVLGKNISLRGESERVIITGDELGPMVQSPNDFPDVCELAAAHQGLCGRSWPWS